MAHENARRDGEFTQIRDLELCELPKGHHALTSKWIYKRKCFFMVATKKNVLTLIKYFLRLFMLLAFVALFDLELE